MIRRVRRTAGVALLSVMSIVGIAAVLAYHVLSMQSITVAHSSLSLNYDYAMQYVHANEKFVQEWLRRDWDDGQSREFDAYTENWAQNLPNFGIPGGSMRVRVIDLSSKFNLNALSDESNTEVLAKTIKLFERLNLDIDTASKWKDWVDLDTQKLMKGAEDYEYAIYEPPFRTPNQMAADLSELLIFSNIDNETVNTMREYVATLPTHEFKVNINTVSEVVLRSLFSKQSLQNELGTLFLGPRMYKSTADAISSIPALDEVKDMLKVTSDFFLLEQTITYGADRLRIDVTSEMYRSPNTGIVTIYKRDTSRRHSWSEDRGLALHRQGT